MNEVIIPSQVQFNEQDRIKEGTFRFGDMYAGRKVSQFTPPRGGRHYEVDGYQFAFASVTSITGVVNKRGIPDWYKKKGIEKAIDLIAKPTMIKECQSVANEKNDRAKKHNAKQPKVRWNDEHTWQTIFYDKAKVGPKEAMDFATEFGNDSHDIIEFLTMNDMGKNPDLLLINDALWSDYSGYMPIAEGFKAWVRDSGMHVVASEMMVYHPAYKYAGTIDLVCALDKDPHSLVVVDIKTGGVFDEAAMQVSAYAQALGYLLTPGYTVKEALVLQLPRERPTEWDADKLYEIYKVNNIQGYFDAFDTAYKLRGLLEKEAWQS